MIISLSYKNMNLNLLIINAINFAKNVIVFIIHRYYKNFWNEINR